MPILVTRIIHFLMAKRRNVWSTLPIEAHGKIIDSGNRPEKMPAVHGLK